MFSVGDLLVLSQPINELRSLDSNTDFISNKTDINKYVWTNLLSFDFGGDVSPAKVKEFMFSSWTFFLDWLKEKNLTESARDREMIRYTLWSAVWCILTQLQGSFWVYFCSRPKRRIKTWFRTCGCVRYVRYTQYMNNNFNQNNKHKNTRRSEGLNHESSNSILFSLDSKWLPPKP